METSLQRDMRSKKYHPQGAFATGLAWGGVGGFVGMLVVDLLLMGALSLVGLSPLACFSTVGDTVARFLTILGLDTIGGVAMGVATHYLVGPFLGAVFGAVLVRYGKLREGTLKVHVVVAVLYAEAVSQPLFAMIPLMMKMGAMETIIWFVGSVVMHFIWGIVLGAIVSRGLRAV